MTDNPSMLFYLLNPTTHEVTVSYDAEVWAEAFESQDRRVAVTHIGAGVKVSTVFLGIDHRFGDGPPILFETMVFGGPLDGTEQRYATWEEAVVGHQRVVSATMVAHTPWKRVKAYIKVRAEKLQFSWFLFSRETRLRWQKAIDTIRCYGGRH